MRSAWAFLFRYACHSFRRVSTQNRGHERASSLEADRIDCRPPYPLLAKTAEAVCCIKFKLSDFTAAIELARCPGVMLAVGGHQIGGVALKSQLKIARSATCESASARLHAGLRSEHCRKTHHSVGSVGLIETKVPSPETKM